MGAVCCNRTSSNGFNLKEGRVRLDFYNEGGEMLADVTQRGSGCPIPANMEGQVGQDSDLVEDVPAHCRGVGLNDL